MDFSVALEYLKLGRRVTREGWNGKGQFIELQRPDENSFMSLPYIFIKTTTEHYVPWVASQTDILARDWRLFDSAFDDPGYQDPRHSRYAGLAKSSS